MRRELRIVAWTLLLGTLWVAGSKAMAVLRSMELFRVTDAVFTGLDYLDRAEAMRLLRLDADVSIWSDTERWEQRLLESPLVASVRVRRRVPGTLVVHVTERRPVALVPTPTLEPVDARGVRLPIDPAERRLDLPVMLIDERAARRTRLLPSRGRELAAEVARLQDADTAFVQLVSEVAWQDGTSVVARWTDPEVDFLMEPGASPRRLREGLAALADALGREPSKRPTQIDLRYADQVVVRRKR
jgi:cell division septal protein FtsQ